MSDEKLPPSQDGYHIAAYFSGRVQGVGFRYQTLQVAKGFEVTGYAKNLSDGRVLLEAEGTRKEVESFLEEVEDQMVNYIRHAEKKGGFRKQRFFDFTIQ